jgi:RND family efflux transporter MFP subunit
MRIPDPDAGARLGQDLQRQPSLADLRISPEERAPRRNWPILAGAAALALLVAAGFLVSRWVAGRPTVRVVRVATLPVAGAAAIVASGYVEAENELDVAPRITSTVVEISVEEGTRVAKGDVLVRLDTKELDAQLAEGEAVWSHARARLDRVRKLHAQGFESPAALEEADAAERSARARVEYARVQLAHAIVRAPFDGVVTKRYAHVGEVVSPLGATLGDLTSTDPLLTLVDFSTLHVAVDVAEGQIGDLHEGRRAEIELEAFPGVLLPGELTAMARSADRQRGTLTANVRFLERDARVMPGLSARVRFLPAAEAGAVRNAFAIPSAAIVERDGKTGVFVVRDGVIQFREVEIRSRQGDRVEVGSGLRAGESIVAPADASALSPGLEVRVAGRRTP